MVMFAAAKRVFPIVFLILSLTACDAPDSRSALASGERFEWEAREGRWLVVNYWAEWCRPCYEEIPELNELDEEAHVQVLGVNYDELQGEELDEVIDRMGIGFPTLVRDPAERFGWEKPTGLPATFIISPEGEWVDSRFGIQTRESLLARLQADGDRTNPE